MEDFLYLIQSVFSSVYLFSENLFNVLFRSSIRDIITKWRDLYGSDFIDVFGWIDNALNNFSWYDSPVVVAVLASSLGFIFAFIVIKWILSIIN